jgi:hypothetical protein
LDAAFYATVQNVEQVGIPVLRPWTLVAWKALW